MALISCPECNEQISDAAFQCPKCGVKLREPKRGFFGKLFKYGFSLFNIVMLLWVIGGAMSVSDTMSTVHGSAEHAGAMIGIGLGYMMIGTIWVFGDIILGALVLFTRPKAS